MTDVVNSTRGNVGGDVVQVGDVGRDLTINYPPPKRSLLVRVAVVAGVVVLGLLVVVANLGRAEKPASLSVSSSAPPASTTASSTTTSVPRATTTQPSAVTVAPPRPLPPAVQQPQQTVGPQPTSTPPANDGPGYLLPSNNDQKAIDFYDNPNHDAVIWDRHPPGTEPSYQPHWVREFTDAGTFRIRNDQVNRCLEPVSDPERGDHVVANICSGSEAQLWRTQNTTQYASVKFGACLSVANNGSYANGTWLYLASCTGTPDQHWRLAR